MMRGKLQLTTDDLIFDTDCFSSFLWVNGVNILQELYGGRIVLPETVYTELSNPRIPHIKERTDKLIEDGDASVKMIETGTKEYEIYSELTRSVKGRKAIGKGEAGGIALAHVHNGILASNNHKDIDPYIDQYNLKHLDTGLILKEALEKKLITEDDGNQIWDKMLKKRRILPAKSFSEYLSRVE